MRSIETISEQKKGFFQKYIDYWKNDWYLDTFLSKLLYAGTFLYTLISLLRIAWRFMA